MHLDATRARMQNAGFVIAYAPAAETWNAQRFPAGDRFDRLVDVLAPI